MANKLVWTGSMRTGDDDEEWATFRIVCRNAGTSNENHVMERAMSEDALGNPRWVTANPGPPISEECLLRAIVGKLGEKA